MRQVLEILLERTYSYPKFPVRWMGGIENPSRRSGAEAYLRPQGMAVIIKMRETREYSQQRDLGVKIPKMMAFSFKLL